MTSDLAVQAVSYICTSGGAGPHVRDDAVLGLVLLRPSYAGPARRVACDLHSSTCATRCQVRRGGVS